MDVPLIIEYSVVAVLFAGGHFQMNLHSFRISILDTAASDTLFEAGLVNDVNSTTLRLRFCLPLLLTNFSKFNLITKIYNILLMTIL